MKKRFIPMALSAVLLTGCLTSCDEETLSTILNIVGMVVSPDDTTIVTEDGRGLGWLSNNEDTEHIENDIRLNPVVGTDIDEVTGLPTMVDLTPCLPPIGDQGQYGTCCAWSTAYYTRTWHYALDNNLRTKDLSKKNTFSPGDVFRSLESNQKGAKCQGANFEYILNNFISRGVATLDVAPYVKNEEDCDCAPSTSARTNAANYKIQNYRQVNLDLKSIKRYLTENHVVMFGAKLSDSFMLLKDATVLRNHTTYNYTGIHAYHAMTIVGYDDDKGPNGAFRIVNSWGDSWGDKGYAWIDYKFFLGGDFANCAFIMNTDGSENSAVQPTPSPNTGLDLIASKCTDVDFNDPNDADSDDPTWRTLFYDVTNAGTDAVESSNDWAVVYLLYNAYNANDYQIVLADIYSDDLGSVAKGECNDNWSAAEARKFTGFDAQGFSISNIDIPAKTTASEAVYGKGAGCFEWTYKLPNVTGYYYLVLMADAFGNITETNDDNNQHYLMAADKTPLYIENGVIKTQIGNNKALKLDGEKPRMNEQMPYQTPQGTATVNTYSPKEVLAMINNHLITGELSEKISQWQEGNAVKPRRCVRK